MEKSKEKNGWVMEIVILLIVLVCAALILTHVSQNLMSEINAQSDQAAIESTLDVPIPTSTPDLNSTPVAIIRSSMNRTLAIRGFGTCVS